ncbi:MAG: YegS/Rv2252/BmrU family lipid kinase [Ktedonobacterales bacterium]
MAQSTKHHVRACLITNPRSGRGGIDLTEALRVLDAQGWEVAVRQKLHGGHATQLAREAAREGYDVVVDCGGDGTLSEIVDGLVGTGVAIGTLPGGTVNLWTRELGISRNLRVAAMQLINAERRRVDVGKLEINGGHSQHFLLMAGLGFDAAVMARVSKPLKHRIGPLAVGIAAVEALPAFHMMPVQVEIDGIHWEGRVAQIIVGNTRRYAGFTRITPAAYVDDGLLDLCLITKASPISAVRQIGSLLLRQRPSDADTEHYRAASIMVHAPHLLPLQIDGGSVPLTKEGEADKGITFRFTSVTQGISVLMPRTYDGELFHPDYSRDARVFVPPSPTARQHAHTHDNGNGRHEAPKGVQTDGAPHPSKKERQSMRVLTVGVDCLTAARLPGGRVLTVQIQPDTTLKNGSDGKMPLWGMLSSLAEGDIVRVKGQKDRAHGVIVARRVRLLSSHAGA